MAKLLRITFPSGGGTNIDMTNPLKSDDPFILDAKSTVKRSVSGKEHVAHDYNEESKLIDITYETLAIRDTLISFFDTHASLGNSFDIIEDVVGAPGTSIECTMVTKKLIPKREGKGVDFWSIKFTVRKIK